MIPWFFIILLLIGMVTHIGLGLYSRRFRGQSVQLPFEILMYMCAVWNVTYALDISSDGLAFKILLMKIRFLAMPFISLNLMLIAILFTGHGIWLTKRRMVLLLIIPGITMFLALTTEYSTVFRYNYTLVQTAGDFSVLGFTNGIWTRAVYLPFNYVEESVTLLLLTRVITGSQRLYSRQAMLFFLAVLIPAVSRSPFPFRYNSCQELQYRSQYLCLYRDSSGNCPFQVPLHRYCTDCSQHAIRTHERPDASDRPKGQTCGFQFSSGRTTGTESSIGSREPAERCPA